MFRFHIVLLAVVAVRLLPARGAEVKSPKIEYDSNSHKDAVVSDGRYSSIVWPDEANLREGIAEGEQRIRIDISAFTSDSDDDASAKSWNAETLTTAISTISVSTVATPWSYSDDHDDDDGHSFRSNRYNPYKYYYARYPPREGDDSPSSFTSSDNSDLEISSDDTERHKHHSSHHGLHHRHHNRRSGHRGSGSSDDVFSIDDRPWKRGRPHIRTPATAPPTQPPATTTAAPSTTPPSPPTTTAVTATTPPAKKCVPGVPMVETSELDPVTCFDLFQFDSLEGILNATGIPPGGCNTCTLELPRVENGTIEFCADSITQISPWSSTRLIQGVICNGPNVVYYNYSQIGGVAVDCTICPQETSAVHFCFQPVAPETEAEIFALATVGVRLASFSGSYHGGGRFGGGARWDASAYAQRSSMLVSWTPRFGGTLVAIQCEGEFCQSRGSIYGLITQIGIGQEAYFDAVYGIDGLLMVVYYNWNLHNLQILRCLDPQCSEVVFPTNLDENNDVGRFCSMAMTSGGLIRIAYLDADIHALMLLSCVDTSCSFTLPPLVLADDTGDFIYSSIGCQANDNPVIAYVHEVNGLSLLRCATPDCQSIFAPVAVGGTSAQFLSMGINQEEGIYVVYYDSFERALKYIDDTDTAAPTTVVPNVGTSSRIASDIGPDGSLIISYVSSLTHELTTLFCGTSSCDNPSLFEFLVLDGAGTAPIDMYMSNQGASVTGYQTDGTLVMRVGSCLDSICSTFQIER